MNEIMGEEYQKHLAEMKKLNEMPLQTYVNVDRKKDLSPEKVASEDTEKDKQVRDEDITDDDKKRQEVELNL